MNEYPRCFNAAARLGLTALALGTLALAARAQQPSEGMEPTENLPAAGSQWGIGIGVGFEKKPYRAFDDKAQVLPLIMYANRYVSVLGPVVDVHLPSAGPLSLRLRARYAGDGYEAEDSPYLAGMGERKAGFWLGGAATWRNEAANLSAELLADASGHSKGTRYKVQVDRRFTTGAFGWTPRVAAQWLDKKYVDYYYGVQASEARTGRPRYEGEAVTNMEVGLRLDYAAAPKQDVFVDLSATRLGSAIKIKF